MRVKGFSFLACLALVSSAAYAAPSDAQIKEARSRLFVVKMTKFSEFDQAIVNKTKVTKDDFPSFIAEYGKIINYTGDTYSWDSNAKIVIVCFNKDNLLKGATDACMLDPYSPIEIQLPMKQKDKADVRLFADQGLINRLKVSGYALISYEKVVPTDSKNISIQPGTVFKMNLVFNTSYNSPYRSSTYTLKRFSRWSTPKSLYSQYLPGLYFPGLLFGGVPGDKGVDFSIIVSPVAYEHRWHMTESLPKAFLGFGLLLGINIVEAKVEESSENKDTNQSGQQSASADFTVQVFTLGAYLNLSDLISIGGARKLNFERNVDDEWMVILKLENNF